MSLPPRSRTSPTAAASFTERSTCCAPSSSTDLRARHDDGNESITDADVAKLTDLITAARERSRTGRAAGGHEPQSLRASQTESFPDLGALTDAELKELIRKLTDEEREISYQRRILHGKIDILRAELVNRMRTQREEGEATITGEDIEQLTEILVRQGRRWTRRRPTE